MVAKILGRVSGDNGVMIEEDYSSVGGKTNSMQQAYTCVVINTILTDYSSMLTETDTTRAVRVRFQEGTANDANKVKIIWGMDEENTTENKFNFRFSHIDEAQGKVVFPALRGDTQVARPPMLSVGLVQTAKQFSLNDFELANEGTDRGTVFLVPSDNIGIAEGSQDDNYVGAYDGHGNNVISPDDIIKSNNRAVKNLPFVVYCDVVESRDCSATLELPNVIGEGGRSDDTFMIVVSIPYGEPSAKFSLEFYDRDGNLMTLSGMQIEVDSTGRANNLYRRVMARLEPVDTNFPYPLFGIELLGSDDGEGLLSKPSAVLCEYQIWAGATPTCGS